MATIESLGPSDNEFSKSWDAMRDWILGAYGIPQGDVRPVDASYSSYALLAQINQIRMQHMMRSSRPIIVSPDRAELCIMLTETQWLSSNDPIAMWRCVDPQLTRIWHKEAPQPWSVWTPRRQGLLDIECYRVTGMSWSGWVNTIDQTQPKHALLAWAMNALCWALREIFGNPYNPTKLTSEICHNKECPEYGEDGHPYQFVLGKRACGRCGTQFALPSWYTTNVQQVAMDIHRRRAFAEYPVLIDALLEAECPESVPCPVCAGDGYELFRVKGPKCLYCLGQGTIASPLFLHLRGQQRCLECLGAGESCLIADSVEHERWRAPLGEPCTACGGKGWQPIPFPHTQGCWALEMLLNLDQNDTEV